MWIAITIFAIVYVLLATEIVEKAIAATLGAIAVIICGKWILSPEGLPFTWEHATNAIELNVIFLLVGMMTCVAILAETGFFEFVSIYVAKKMRGNAFAILAMMLILTMIFSAFLDNVTTIILLAPVTILLTQLLELPTVPFLIFEALVSNIGGTSTLIGDPPNIIIGNKAQLSFTDFLVNLTPVVIVMGIVFIILVTFYLRKQLRLPKFVQMRVINSYPSEAIIDRKKMYRSLFVFALIFIGFGVHHHFNIQPGIIALLGMGIMLLLCRCHAEHFLRLVEWDTILFFIGLFIMIGALEHAGVVDQLATLMLSVCGDNRLLTCMVVLFGSAIFSAVLDNIPFVIAMTPLVQKLILDTNWVTDGVKIVAETGSVTGPHPLFWALSLGACLGGNGTLIGASANIVAAKVGERNGYKISFFEFMKYGVVCTIITTIIAAIDLWLRYF